MKWQNKILAIVCILFATYEYCICEHEVIKIIEQFIKIQKMPTKINSFLCWNKKKMFEFTKTMNKAGFQVSPIHANTFNNKNLPTFWPAEHQLYMIDMGCKLSVEILQNANRDKLLYFPYRWLILQNEKQNVLFDIYLHLNSRIYVFHENNMTIHSYYKINSTGNVLINNVASIKNGNLLHFNKIIDGRNRTNLMKLDLNISVVTLYEDSVNHLEDFRFRELDSHSKYNWMLLINLVDCLNITPHYRFYRNWGVLIPNTTIFTALVGDLQLGISEIGGTGTFYTTDRIPFMDYNGPFTPTNAYFYFIKPPLSMVSNIFAKPFGRGVWFAACLTLIIVFIVIYIIIRWEWHDETFQENISSKYSVLRPRVLDIIQMEIGAIFQQGTEAEPKSLAGTIATFVVFLAFMFLYVSYSANIVALLQSTSDDIKTVRDLINSKIELAVEETPYNRYHIPRQTAEIQKLLFVKKLAPQKNFYISLKDGAEKMKNGFFGLHTEGNGLYTIMSKTFLESEKCGLTKITFWSILPPTMACKKNSTYRELIKKSYLKQLESGINNRNFQRTYQKEPVCQNPGANFVNVSINDCYFALVSFTIGIVISIIVLFIEKSMSPKGVIKESSIQNRLELLN